MLSPYNVITYCHVFFTHPSVVVGHLERIYRLAPENSTEKMALYVLLIYAQSPIENNLHIL